MHRIISALVTFLAYLDPALEQEQDRQALDRLSTRLDGCFQRAENVADEAGRLIDGLTAARSELNTMRNRDGAV